MAQKRRRRGKGAGSLKNSGPLVHVKVAYIETDLGGAAALVKPALLYADRVTIYSPVASMVNDVLALGGLKDSRARFSAALDLIEAIPQFRDQLNADPQVLTQLRAVVAVDPRLLRRAAALSGGKAVMDEFLEHLDELSSLWDGPMQEAMNQVIETAGAKELLVAIKAGAVEVADLSGAAGTTAVVADSVRAALGDRRPDSTDDLMNEFLARVVEMLTNEETFPLLDGSSAGLIRAMEQESKLEPSPLASRRGSEIHAAADFMSFLPYFTELPMDEVLDLRRKLAAPLARFRAEMVSVARDFQTRSFDPEFALEVHDAWRQRVEPALADIREALAEHGLLREVKSVALGDLKTLLVEAGGVVAAVHGEVISLSRLMTAVVAAGLPAAHVVGRAIKEMQAERREVRKGAFYFLHRLAEEAGRGQHA